MVEHCEIKQYADDIMIYYVSDNAKGLPSTDHEGEWHTEQNVLKLNEAESDAPPKQEENS